MTKKSTTTPLPTVAAQCLRPLSVNVREAAKQLRVSASTVYRLDRKNGPIRFISAKRPITIDQGSLESSRQPRAPSADDVWAQFVVLRSPRVSQGAADHEASIATLKGM